MIIMALDFGIYFIQYEIQWAKNNKPNTLVRYEIKTHNCVGHVDISRYVYQYDMGKSLNKDWGAKTSSEEDFE